MCELISKIVFNKRGSCCNLMLYFCLFIAWPFIFLFFSIVLGGILPWMLYSACCKNCMVKLLNSRKGLNKLPQKFCIFRVVLKILFLIAYSIPALILICLFVASSLTLGLLLFGLAIVPSIIVFFIIVIKLNFVWSNNVTSTTSSTKETQKSDVENVIAQKEAENLTVTKKQISRD